MHASVSSKVPQTKPHAKPLSIAVTTKEAKVDVRLGGPSTAPRDQGEAHAHEDAKTTRDEEISPTTPRGRKVSRSPSLIPVRVGSSSVPPSSRAKDSPTPSFSEEDKTKRIEELEALVAELHQSIDAETTTMDGLLAKNESLMEQNQQLDAILQQANLAMKELASQVNSSYLSRSSC